MASLPASRFSRACLALLFASALLPAAAQTTTLDGADWKMRGYPLNGGEGSSPFATSLSEDGFRTVTVPGDAQLQLGMTGIERFRPSPQLLAVNKQEWWYRKHFRTAAARKGSRVRLTFDGVDYFTTVWLNGRLLGSHEGTYTNFSFDVTDFLRPGKDNVLAVRVSHPWVPPGGRGLNSLVNGGFSLASPWVNLPLKDAPYFTEMHWDALPSGGNIAYAMGIWRSVHLDEEAAVSLRDLHVSTTSLNPDGSATLRLEATVNNAGSSPQPVALQMAIRPANFSGASVQAPLLRGQAAIGETTLAQTFTLPAAHLWWSWDQGAQDLYRISASIARSSSPQPGETRDLRFGVRTVSQDAQDMSFRLNGRRVFLKGSHFPIEDFYRSTPTHDSYERDLRLLRAANFNSALNFTAVEKPEFYDLCDELGILLIAQMPFPQFGPMQVLEPDNPYKQQWLRLAHETARNYILQLRQHPSIFEWAPLAEAHDKAEHGRWGANGFDWNQQGYDEFISDMRSLVTTLAPGDVFHPSICDFGEQHFWNGAAAVGAADSSYRDHFDATAGFVSEYGSISMSSTETLGRYLTPSEMWDAKTQRPRWLDLPIDTAAYAYWTSIEYDGLWSMLWRAHHMVDRHPAAPADLVRDTQQWQSFLMGYAAESYRRHKYGPIMGMRNWCFLELSPGFRFGVVDYDRVPKAAYYTLRRVQAPVAVSFAFKDALAGQLAGSKWSTPVFVINDTQSTVTGSIHVSIVDLHGLTRKQQDFPVAAGPDSKQMAGTFSATLDVEPGVYALRAVLKGADGKVLAEEPSFLKVVAPYSARPLRVLLIGQSTYAEPIAATLRNLGAEVDGLDENRMLHPEERYSNSAALRAGYDVIWIARFDWLAKVLPHAVDNAMTEAVRQGTALVHTGGKGSFHGGWIHPAMLEATEIGKALPVQLNTGNDIVPGERSESAELTTAPILSGYKAEDSSMTVLADALKTSGLSALNHAATSPGSRVLLSVADEPLLVGGQFGKAHTAVFTGFTPVIGAHPNWSYDERLSGEPATRALFLTVNALLDTVGLHASGDLLEQRVAPLFEILGRQTGTSLTVETAGYASTRDGDAFDSTMQLRVHNNGGYAHAVHLTTNWKGIAPFFADWSDNDFDLMPGETRTLSLHTRSHAQESVGSITWSGANVAGSTVELKGMPSARLHP